MKIRDARREAAIDKMADHLLREGLGGARLRSLAAAAGTSDRMLMYYFAGRSELLAATLERIAARLTALLDAAIPAGTRLPAPALLRTAWAAVGSPALAPYMRVWLELAAGAASGQAPHQPIAAAIMAGFARWTEAHLDDDGPGRGGAAALVLATIEGCLFLDAVGRRDLAEAALAASAARD